jgi:hypothetical protein
MRWIVAVLVGAGCTGGSTGDCDTRDDCPPGEECTDGDEVVCGIPPRQECSDAAGCGTGFVCHAIPDSCSPSGIGSACEVACTVNSCGPGFRCNAEEACEPEPCTEGAVCALGQACDPASVGPLTTGCVETGCAADGDCPTEGPYCVNGACGPNPGTCVEPQAVP